MMDTTGDGATSPLFPRLVSFLRRCLFKVISVGPIPHHVAFIMDGNRRYANKLNSALPSGHKAGYSSLMSMLLYCYELGVKYVTVYAFSIDNFKRQPDEVHYLMDLMLEKIHDLLRQESFVNQYGVRVYFIGNLKLLDDPVRVAAEKAMKATADNNKVVLLVCVAYTSCDEIVHAVKQSCKAKRDEIQALNETKVSNGESYGHGGDKNIALKNKGLVIHDVHEPCGDVVEGSNEDTITTRMTTDKQRKLPIIKLVDVEKHMYMAVAPDPDIVIRSSGEMRLSNFLLWQTAYCPLYSPAALWPELGLWHLVWAVLNFQRSYRYLEKKKKKL